MTTEMVMIGMSILILVGILLHHPSRTLGIPSLLIFMGVGLMLGNGEFNFVYDDLDKTAWIGGLALNMIVFVGGINTSTDKIKVAYKEGGVLASFGVLFTTLFFAVILYWLLEFDFITCLLFAAIVSSTDAAAVFSILESKKLKLKEQTDTVLEFESATNDPVAMLLVIFLTDMALSTGKSVVASEIAIELVTQIGVAMVVGWLVAKIAVLLLNRIHLSEFGLIPVFVLASFVVATYGAELLGGNILLASYIAGVVIGNGIKRGQAVNLHFFNSLSWLAQALMFIVLGLQIFPQSLASVFVNSLLPAILLILVARPLAVQLCYLPFVKASWKKRMFISAIGLKGATPIVFALIPAAAGVPGALDIVHMVFFIVLFSVFIQGGAIAPLANKLGLNNSDKD
ncbi:potassium/proton antiporter [Shewanella fidelis]|uniref:Potassium/proton antiporter n=1 Tax=Shewanella fidelis TaxID=173509 RepID=A0AAW8NRZ4_9GAMM|nr:potassium/proton antiporter [Shewanella fidelis]MDR8525893.1 potassium/proton antiporter [Shewanella fidelis]MDW4813984.1 potassium/proton antiporter [Shewanella fidelis]MDW4818015.1 potassium/proton antiporter [Shewanella fidelis]MDW4822147.1 potassium/proton antiporter [Shewanella fidelis]MDW4826247.1 potassium/proton antiporter [Shewanella fidelis]